MSVSGTPPYDPANIFARILRDEIPSRRVFEDEHAIAFHDIAPQAPTHILVIPRGPYVALPDFLERASDAEVLGFWRAVATVAKQHGLEAPGYRILANKGHDAGQEVPHLHVHLFGGGPLGPMLTGVASPAA